MGTGYTAIMYDAEDIEDAFGDIAACRYDGIEIGLEKIRANGPEKVGRWLDEYNLDLYLAMSEWIESEDAVQRVLDDIPTVADLGAEFVGILPPQRARYDDLTVEQWLSRISDTAVEAGVRPVVHHHGATAIEQPGEIRRYLDAVDGLELLFDTAHYYPYSENFPAGDVTDGIEQFADDIAYVHLKDVDPVKDFAANRDALSAADFHLDNVINYFRSFTDLGNGILDFEAIHKALTDTGYEGHYTIEIENQTDRPLIHAKENYDYWSTIQTV
ncbi:xylose isomerase (plasmid) [Halostagnicola larsenii XH-48]|uniref:Xylose isomerase n=1 Tax=Halostagnicola larsenii XH-48 TaxID=797299 RepID=W0JXB4_9EURY|nr:TIM barrel protein [Halostagnicola larsenii]AHG01850.1 xylose isomerase [Halostagnicola larsenii XH-48]